MIDILSFGIRRIYQYYFDSMKEPTPLQETSDVAMKKINLYSTKRISLEPIRSSKTNQIVPLDTIVHPKESELPEKVIKKPSKTQKNIKNVNIVVAMPSNHSNIAPNHSQLENFFQIKTHFSLGSFLKTIQFQGHNSNPYTCVKTDKFPFSRFSFTENKQNGRTFELVSNFWGNKYSLQLEGNNICQISFTVSCGISSPSRQFQIWVLRPGINHSNLQKINGSQKLSDLYQVGQNKTKIMKLKSFQPKLNLKKGFLTFSFAKKSVVASVQNCSIVDEQGIQVMEMYKTDEKSQMFQICFTKTIEMEWGFAFALASLDFKLALQ